MHLEKRAGLAEAHWEILPEVSADERAALVAATSTFYVIFEREKALAVIGAMPHSRISPNFTLWFGMRQDYSPRISELKQARAVFRLIVQAEQPQTFRAEIAAGDKVGARFARFFGFTELFELHSRRIYERAI